MSSAHSPSFPLLHLRHSLFSNPSVELCSFSKLFVTSPTSQFILQPFFPFSYVTWRAAHGRDRHTLYLRSQTAAVRSWMNMLWIIGLDDNIKPVKNWHLNWEKNLNQEITNRKYYPIPLLERQMLPSQQNDGQYIAAITIVVNIAMIIVYTNFRARQHQRSLASVMNAFDDDRALHPWISLVKFLWHLSYSWGKILKKMLTRKTDSTGDRTRAR